MSRLKVLLLASTLVTGAMSSAFAQAAEPQPVPPSASSTTKATPDAPPAEAAENASREGDRHAFFEARLAALHAGLTLTADQERMWPLVEQAIRNFVKVRAELKDQRSDARQDRDDGSDDNTDYIAALKTYADAQGQRADALKRVADAAGPLYATLSADQRHRIPPLLQSMAPRHHGQNRMDEDRMDEDHMGGEPHRGEHHGDRRDWSNNMNAQRGGMYGGAEAGHHTWNGDDRDDD